MENTIAQCHTCRRYFKMNKMERVEVQDGLLTLSRFVCAKCWAKIERGSGAEEAVIKRK